MVCKVISTQNAGNIKPSVFAIDVTNPREPILMWGKSFDDLGFSTNFPAVIKALGRFPAPLRNRGNGYTPPAPQTLTMIKQPGK